MENNANIEITNLQEEGWKLLHEQYHELLDLYSSWKETSNEHYDNEYIEDIAEEEVDKDADVYEAYDLDYLIRHDDPDYVDDEDNESEGMEEYFEYLDELSASKGIQHKDKDEIHITITEGATYKDEDEIDVTITGGELEKTLEKINTVIIKHDSSQVPFLFDKAEEYSQRLGIEFFADHERINNALSITHIKNISFLFTPPKPKLIVPSLIVPSQEYLISLIKKDPKLLFGISSRQFEELIAEIFYKFGFNVELTQATRDGGRDIIAINEIQNIKTKYLIECKRYKPSRKISVSIVRDLWAVKMDESANKAILVTTSSYTRDATVFASKHMWDLDLKGYNDVIGWVNSYKSILPPSLT